jgi:hypothetical protein
MNPKGEAFAYLYGVLHLPTDLKGGVLLVGSSDGAKVWIDRKVVSSTDGNRPQRDDEDVARLDLPRGDHGVLVKLHHRDGYWAFRMRVVDSTFTAVRGAFFRLPASDSEVRSLTAKMADIDVNRGLSATGFQPSVTVSFPEGMLRGTDRAVRVTATGRAGERKREIFVVEGGEVPLAESGPSELKVQLPAIAAEELGENEEGAELVLSVEVAGRKLDAASPVRPFMHQAMAAATRAIALCPNEPSASLTAPGVTRTTMVHLRDRFAGHVNGGDKDLEVLALDARTIVEYAADIEARRDPLRVHAGIRRFAYKSPLDDEPSPFGMYVPPSYVNAHGASTKSYPLIVVLHGLNGRPNSMMGHFFGRDDENRDPDWEDRHPPEVEPIEAFVLSPTGTATRCTASSAKATWCARWTGRPAFTPSTRIASRSPARRWGAPDRPRSPSVIPIATPPPSRSAATTAISSAATSWGAGSALGSGCSSSNDRTPTGPTTAFTCRSTSGTAGVTTPRRTRGCSSISTRRSATAWSTSTLGSATTCGPRRTKGSAVTPGCRKRRAPSTRSAFSSKPIPFAIPTNAWVHVRDISGDVAFATIDATIVDTTQITVSTERVEAFALDSRQ